MSRFNSRRSTLSQGYRKPLLYGFGILTILFLVSRRNVGDKGLPAVRADLNQSGAKVHSPVTGVAEEPAEIKAEFNQPYDFQNAPGCTEIVCSRKSCIEGTADAFDNCIVDMRYSPFNSVDRPQYSVAAYLPKIKRCGIYQTEQNFRDMMGYFTDGTSDTKAFKEFGRYTSYNDYSVYSALEMKLDQKEDAEFLSLGVGGGKIIFSFDEKFPNMNVDIVEINEAMIYAMKEWFCIPKNPNHHFFIDDAYNFVEKSTKKYDYILMDIWPVPEQFKTETYLKLLKDILKEDGLLVFNLSSLVYNINTDIDEQIKKTNMETKAKAVFEHVRVGGIQIEEQWWKFIYCSNIPLDHVTVEHYEAS